MWAENQQRNKRMTQEEKELLFKDLCARLPYHVKVKVWLKDGTTEEGELDLEHNYSDVLKDAFYFNDIKDIKPYLRPLTRMAEEEEIAYLNLEGAANIVDWLNAHHFDYRGLIPKGLALVASEGM